MGEGDGRDPLINIPHLNTKERKSDAYAWKRGRERGERGGREGKREGHCAITHLNKAAHQCVANHRSHGYGSRYKHVALLVWEVTDYVRRCRSLLVLLLQLIFFCNQRVEKPGNMNCTIMRLDLNELLLLPYNT